MWLNYNYPIYEDPKFTIICVSLSLGWLGSTAGADGRPAAGDVRSRRAPGGPLGGPSVRLSVRPSVRPAVRLAVSSAGRSSGQAGGHSSRVRHSLRLRHSSHHPESLLPKKERAGGAIPQISNIPLKCKGLSKAHKVILAAPTPCK